MIRFKISGYHQHKEAEKLAENVPHLDVHKTFAQMPDDSQEAFQAALNASVANARACHDRGRCNALGSIRRHYEEAEIR